jgi:uncharacterized protein YbaR (Trm112 family)
MPQNIDELRDEEGKLPRWAWPGCYPMMYYTRDHLVICPDCANKDDVNPEQEVVAAEANWEDPDLYCEDCNERIPSAYADEDDDPDPEEED